MERYPLILFLTDFGPGPYPAACEAVLYSVAPDVRMVHVDHGVKAGSIRAGGLTLSRIAPLAPQAIHLAIVDPGVGTTRRGVVLRAARGDFLVGPDNGLLLPAGRSLGGVTSAWELDHEQIRSRTRPDGPDASATFHGRDVFAPAAALLASGLPPGMLGEVIGADTLARDDPYVWESTPQGTRSQVLEVDGFGNVGLAVPHAELDPALLEGGRPLEVRNEEGTEEWPAYPARTFGELPPGRLGLIADSWGQAALVMNGDSAARRLEVGEGDALDLMGTRTRSPRGTCP